MAERAEHEYVDMAKMLRYSRTRTEALAEK